MAITLLALGLLFSLLTIVFLFPKYLNAKVELEGAERELITERKIRAEKEESEAALIAGKTSDSVILLAELIKHRTILLEFMSVADLRKRLSAMKPNT